MDTIIFITAILSFTAYKIVHEVLEYKKNKPTVVLEKKEPEAPAPGSIEEAFESLKK